MRPGKNISFEEERNISIKKQSKDNSLKKSALDFIVRSSKFNYSYNFKWLGRPIIQLPQDVLALQEIIWQVKPRLIIETGVAHGGSVIFSASILKLLNNGGQVIGIEVEIREHNRKAINLHPVSSSISLIEGSSTDPGVIAQVHKAADGIRPIMVFLDSNHTYDHVLHELRIYAPLVTVGSYVVVFDTTVDDMPVDSFPDRPWDKNNNPKTAVRHFLKKFPGFEVDEFIDQKLLISSCLGGYLRRVR